MTKVKAWIKQGKAFLCDENSEVKEFILEAAHSIERVQQIAYAERRRQEDILYPDDGTDGNQ